MKNSLNPANRLDNLVSALEANVLQGSDEDVLRSESMSSAENALARKLMVNAVQRSDVVRVSARSERTKTSGPVSRARDRVAARFAFLRALAASRTDLTPELQAVFGASNSQSPRDLDAIEQDLAKLGILKREGPTRE